jgi:hypothetical protein
MICRHTDLTLEVVQSIPVKHRDWFAICENPLLDLEIVEALCPVVYLIRGTSHRKDFFGLDGVTYKDSIVDQLGSFNLYLTTEFILDRHPDWDWNWDQLAQRGIIVPTMDRPEERERIVAYAGSSTRSTIHYYLQARREALEKTTENDEVTKWFGITLEAIKHGAMQSIERYPDWTWNWRAFSLHGHFTMDFLERHLRDFPWHWTELCMNRNVHFTPEFIERHLDDPTIHWSWANLSRRKHLVRSNETVVGGPSAFLERHKEKDWNWTVISDMLIQPG